MAKKVAKKTAKKPAPLVVWVARDAVTPGEYGLYLDEPFVVYGSYFTEDPGAVLVADLCHKHFELMMGIKLKLGERRQFVWAGSPLKPFKPAKRKAAKRAK